MQEATVTFTHPNLNEQVTAIGGNYVLTGERTIGLAGGTLLVLTGYAVFDTTCCGASGCAYALVPGFVDRYRYGKEASGKWQSRVRPIRDMVLRQAVTAVVLERTEAMQVQFLFS